MDGCIFIGSFGTVVELVHFAFNLVGKRMDSLNLEASLMSKFGFRCFGERRSTCAS